MANLKINAKCEVSSSDEIGYLATNINNLYKSLLETIKNLEKEKQNVSIAEREKLDFLRAASHDLKTPITELNVTLENMMMGIGEYKQYEIYLPKCREITERLGVMIKDILNTSRLQMDTSFEKSKIILLQQFIPDICEKYRLIAGTKSISFCMDVTGDVSIVTQPKLLDKAISNILANAVNYTKPEKKVFIILSDNVLTISNECTPLSQEQMEHIFEAFYRPDYSREESVGGNGLGLYIVKTILDRLTIKYDFIVSDVINGMSFIIYFNSRYSNNENEVKLHDNSGTI